jgi:GT2 family glycosyltransferase
MSAVRPASVSVVVVNYRRADDTLACLQGLAGLDWPVDRLEVVVVDNASADGSADRIRAAAPQATVVVSPTNLGFAGGCNLGVEHSTGAYLAFLNNDARPDPAWVRAAVRVLDQDRTIGAVASKVLDWEGTHVDYVDGALTWYGMGYKREVGRPDSPDLDRAQDVLFGTGAAMFVRADLFRQVGGFDDRFFMFYEDVDLGWRLNLLGHRVRYVPESRAFHRHHASLTEVGSWSEYYLHERNALMAMYKNYDDASLAAALPAALALAVRRGTARGGDDTTALDLRRGVDDPGTSTLAVSKHTLAPVYGIDAFLDHLPALAEDRRRLQADRRRTDRELAPLFRQMIEPAYTYPAYLRAHADLVEAFGIDRLFAPPATSAPGRGLLHRTAGRLCARARRSTGR